MCRPSLFPLPYAFAFPARCSPLTGMLNGEPWWLLGGGSMSLLPSSCVFTTFHLNAERIVD